MLQLHAIASCLLQLEENGGAMDRKGRLVVEILSSLMIVVIVAEESTQMVFVSWC